MVLPSTSLQVLQCARKPASVSITLHQPCLHLIGLQPHQRCTAGPRCAARQSGSVTARDARGRRRRRASWWAWRRHPCAWERRPSLRHHAHQWCAHRAAQPHGGQSRWTSHAHGGVVSQHVDHIVMDPCHWQGDMPHWSSAHAACELARVQLHLQRPAGASPQGLAPLAPTPVSRCRVQEPRLAVMTACGTALDCAYTDHEAVHRCARVVPSAVESTT